MAHPYRSQILDPLGLVAGLFDELGIGEVIDQATQQHPAMRIVTASHAVKAMVLNGFGLVNQQLYLVPRCFQHKPTSRLFAPAWIEAKHLNDDALGRALETLYDYGVTALSSLIAATAAERLGLAPTFAHLDSTSFHVDGRYNHDNAPDEQVVHITRGYSRDHRPDLNHSLSYLCATLLCRGGQRFPLVASQLQDMKDQETKDMVEELTEQWRRYWHDDWQTFWPAGPSGRDYIRLQFTREWVEVLSFAAGIAPAPYGLRAAAAVRHGGRVAASRRLVEHTG